MITQSYLKSILHYEPSTGIFTRLTRPSNIVHIGDVVGSIHSDGYLTVRIKNKAYSLHRLVFLYLHGVIPKQIDHINRIKTDNRRCNLRAATHKNNKANSSIQKNNTSGFKGVSWRKKERKWRAKITIDGKDFDLGLFNNPEDAHKVYCKKGKKAHGEFFCAG